AAICGDWRLEPLPHCRRPAKKPQASTDFDSARRDRTRACRLALAGSHWGVRNSGPAPGNQRKSQRKTSGYELIRHPNPHTRSDELWIRFTRPVRVGRMAGKLDDTNQLSFCGGNMSTLIDQLEEMRARINATPLIPNNRSPAVLGGQVKQMRSRVAELAKL